jgi:uncharacterized protein (TIGR00290 family)
VRRAAVFWSGGKDAALALHVAAEGGQMEPCCLLTTFDEESRVVPVHEVPFEIIEAQARLLSLPVVGVPLPVRPSNEQYERALSEAVPRLREHQVDGLVAGDIHLDDVRAYREEVALRMGFSLTFPLWEMPEAEMTHLLDRYRIRSVLVSVDPSRLSRVFLGRDYDAALRSDLPPGVDLRGEQGEFHTLVVDAALFGAPLRVRMGETGLSDTMAHAQVTLEGAGSLKD